MTVRDTIEQKLNAGLAPERLVVEDYSHQHAGHANADPGGGSHIRVAAVSTAFRGQARPQRHRTVHKLLADELAGPVHALALDLRTPEEDAASV